MLAAIPFPNLSPEVFSISIGGVELALRWYALAYIVGILIGWRIVIHACARPAIWGRDMPLMTREQIDDLLTWVILGVIIGGRLGFVLFYQPGYYLQNPLEIPMIWQGGMAFHGGFLGVVAVIMWFCWKHKIPLWNLADALAIATPPAIFLGRIANFINAELWGRPTDLPWGVIFPGHAAQDCPDVVGLCARHPSQLYEALLEGALLGAVLLYLAYRRGPLQKPAFLTGLFFAGYGAARFFVEFFRQADAQYITMENPFGYVVRLGEFGLSMGQLLSIPMIAVGVVLMLWTRGRKAAT